MHLREEDRWIGDIGGQAVCHHLDEVLNRFALQEVESVSRY